MSVTSLIQDRLRALQYFDPDGFDTSGGYRSLKRNLIQLHISLFCHFQMRKSFEILFFGLRIKRSDTILLKNEDLWAMSMEVRLGKRHLKDICKIWTVIHPTWSPKNLASCFFLGRQFGLSSKNEVTQTLCQLRSTTEQFLSSWWYRCENTSWQESGSDWWDEFLLCYCITSWAQFFSRNTWFCSEGLPHCQASQASRASGSPNNAGDLLQFHGKSQPEEQFNDEWSKGRPEWPQLGYSSRVRRSTGPLPSA